MVRLAEVPSEKPIPHGTVTFHPFVVRREGGAFILGNEKLRRYVEVGPEGMRAVELLQEGRPWEEVVARLKVETGREFDLDAFLRRLAPNGFLHTVGPLVVWDGASGPKAHVPAAAPAYKWTRSPVLFSVAFVLSIGGVALLAADPTTIASPREVLFNERPLLSILAFILIGWALTLGHEAAHYMSARAYGIDASISLGTRLHVLVCETDVTNAWKLPAEARGKIILAGLLFNASVLGVAELLLWFAGAAGAAETLLRWLILMNLIQFVFQSLFFIKTDVYYLIVALGRERNLWSRAFRALDSTMGAGPICVKCGGHETLKGDERGCPLCHGGRATTSSGRRWLASYAVATLVGSGLILAAGIFIVSQGTLPFLAFLLELVAQSERAGDVATGLEAIVLLALVGVQLILVLLFAGAKAFGWARARVPTRR